MFNERFKLSDTVIWLSIDWLPEAIRCVGIGRNPTWHASCWRRRWPD